MLLNQIVYKQTTPILIYINNLPALQMINENSSPTDRTSYIDICYFIMVHINRILNLSNDLTKPLGYVL